MEEKINTHLANNLEQSAAMLDSREFDAVQLDNCASMMRYAATVIRQALEQPAPAQPLTDEQIDLFINGRGDEGDDDYVEPTGDGFGLTDADLVRLVRRVEAAHGITKGGE